MIASVAAASGDEVSVFFSMNALPYFVKGYATAAPVEGSFGVLMQEDGGVPSFKQLFKYAAELGDARLLPCSMAILPGRWNTCCTRPTVAPACVTGLFR